jgi:hypothetical protein
MDSAIEKIQSITPERYDQLVLDWEALERGEVEVPPKDIGFAQEWGVLNPLPKALADISPSRVWLQQDSLLLTYYRMGDYSVNLIFTRSESGYSAKLQWGSFRDYHYEQLWERPIQSPEPTTARAAVGRSVVLQANPTFHSLAVAAQL